MCLAVPMKITAIDGYQCTCEAKGVEREVSLFMLQHEDVAVGEFYALGVDSLFAIAASHGRGVKAMIEQVLDGDVLYIAINRWVAWQHFVFEDSSVSLA